MRQLITARRTAVLVLSAVFVAGCAEAPTVPVPAQRSGIQAPASSTHDLIWGTGGVDTLSAYVSHWDGNTGTCNGGGYVEQFELRMTGLDALSNAQEARSLYLSATKTDQLMPSVRYVPRENTRESVNTEVYCMTHVLGVATASRVGTFQFFYDQQGQWQTLCNRICATWAIDWVPAYYRTLAYATASVSSLNLVAGQSTNVVGHAFALGQDGAYVEVFNGGGLYGSARGFLTLGTPSKVNSSFGPRWLNVSNRVTGALAGVDTLTVGVHTLQSLNSVSTLVPVTIVPSVNITGPSSIAAGGDTVFTAVAGGCNPTCTYQWSLDAGYGTVMLGNGASQRVYASDAGDQPFMLSVTVTSNGQSNDATQRVAIDGGGTGGGGGGGGGGGCLTAMVIGDPIICAASTTKGGAKSSGSARRTKTP